MILSAFTKHPATVGETYRQHLAHAASFGIRLMIAGMACLLHGIFPFLFVKTGSKQVTKLHSRMVTNRSDRVDEILDYVI